MKGIICLASLVESFLVPLLMFSRSLIFAVISLMGSLFPQISVLQQEFYTLISKGEKLLLWFMLSILENTSPDIFYKNIPWLTLI